MSKLQVFAIRDKAVETYHQPFTVRNVNEAVRLVGNTLLETDCSLAVNAADYSLWHIGNYDNETAQLEAVDKTKVVDLIDLQVRVATNQIPPLTDEQEQFAESL